MENNKNEAITVDDLKDVEKAIEIGVAKVELAEKDFFNSLKPLTAPAIYRVLQVVMAYPNMLKQVKAKHERELTAMAAGMTFMQAKLELTKIMYLHDTLTEGEENGKQSKNS